MHAFNIVRLVVFGVALGFALVVLGIGANFVAQTMRYDRDTASSVPGFSVATAALTFVILIPVLVIDSLRKGAVTSLAATELGFVGFLWVLWLACAANTTSALGGYSLGNCDVIRDDVLASICHQYEALQAFSWLNWLILLSYWIALLTFTLIAHSRGNTKAFLQPTTDLGTSVTHGGNAAGEPKIPPPQNYPPGGIPPGTYPPQGYPQQSYTPSQYPQQSYTPGQYPQQTPGQMPPQGQMYQPSYGSSYGSSPPPPPPGTVQV